MQERIPTVFMRGGTSRGLFFHEDQLPKNLKIRERILLSAYGSPDRSRMQMNGIGAGTTNTNKVAIISPADSSDYDVNYNFAQVSVDTPSVTYRGNCGNMSSAVGPFAIDERLVRPVEPFTKVRIYQVNTKKLIIAEVPVKNGLYNEEGNYSIAGIPSPGGKITLHYVDPGGSMTGKLLPTGNVKDNISVPAIGKITISIVDAANPVVFVRARDLGLSGNEINEISTSAAFRQKLEAIRTRAAVVIGFASTPEEAGEISRQVPKIVFVSPAQGYQSVSGEIIKNDEIDITARMMSMGYFTHSFALTGAICTAGASKIEGTVVNEMLNDNAFEEDEIRIGFPAGILPIGVKIKKIEKRFQYQEALVYRTSRRLMDGYVYVPQKCFE